MIMKGRAISRGCAQGKVIVLRGPFSFLGGVDANTGMLTVSSGREGEQISARVFVFHRGKGSTVGSYTILDLKKQGTAPAAIINQDAETIVATGAVMAGIPMVDGVDISIMEDGDEVRVDGTAGTVELLGVEELNVVTCVLRYCNKVLVLKRSEKVSTNKGKWAGVSGYIEKGETPLDTAYKEISEEVAMQDPKLLKIGDVIKVRAEGKVWNIHPFLFQVEDDKVVLDWEHTDFRWVIKEELDSLDLVPGFKKLLHDLGFV